MDQEELIQISFQIPPSALDSLSRLAEQLRLLTEAASAPLAPGGRTAETEHMESGSFDPERFLELRQSADAPPEAAGSVDMALGDAKAASALLSPIEDAEPVSAGVQEKPQNARSAGDMLDQRSEINDPSNVSSDMYPAPLEEQDSPISLAEAEAEAPDAWPSVKQQVPDAESVRAEAETRELPMITAQNEVSTGIETPLGAGVVIQTQPEMPQSRWNDITEELVVPGPAPLTAEAVSLAFERDGRRYDNGFPLY